MTAMRTELSLLKVELILYLETEMIDGLLCLSIAISGAKLDLICLPLKLVADLASAPKLCFLNISSKKEGEKKNDEPLFARTFLDRCIFNSLQAEEECWVHRGGLMPMILGLSEDMLAPRGSIADDKVTRLKVDLYYLHLITTSCVLIPADLSPLHPYSTCFASRIMLPVFRLQKPLIIFFLCTHPPNSLSHMHSAQLSPHILSHRHSVLPTCSACKWLQEVRAACAKTQ